MSSANRFGIDGKAYYGAAGSTASTELTAASKVSLKISLQEGEFGSRATGWELSDVSLMSAEVEITIKNSLRNATPIAYFFNAMVNKTAIALKILDAATSSRGIDADFICTGSNNDQDNPSPQEWVFTFKPTYSTRYPTTVTA
jgi:hypothetical protein